MKEFGKVYEGFCGKYLNLNFSYYNEKYLCLYYMELELSNVILIVMSLM